MTLYVRSSVILILLAAFGAVMPPPAVARDDTRIPDLVGCSDGQKNRLRLLWREAHDAVWKAERMITEIARMDSSAQQAHVWSLDHIENLTSSSPRTYFGEHVGHKYAKIVLQALRKAERRFRGGGGAGVLKIKKLRCGQPIAASRNEHFDVCPAGTRRSGPPPAYHAPAGTIVLCPGFWNEQNSPFSDETTKRFQGVRLLVHETFHYLSIDSCPTRRTTCGRYITDYHGDGAGGIKDKKYYSGDIIGLANRSRKYAVRTPDAYAYFAANVYYTRPKFLHVWRNRPPDQPPSRTSAGVRPEVRTNLSWSQLASLKASKADKQKLVDVETYVSAGQRRYMGFWSAGGGKSYLNQHDNWEDFVANWRENRARFELIDLEPYPVGNGTKYLALYIENPRRGQSGGVFKLTWSAFEQRWRSMPDNQYLADVEITGSGSNRQFHGVWRLRDDRRPKGALLINQSPEALTTFVNGDGNTQQLVDLERYLVGGQEKFLGVWRRTGVRQGAVWFSQNESILADHWRTSRRIGQSPVDFDLIVEYPLRFKPDQ